MESFETQPEIATTISPNSNFNNMMSKCYAFGNASQIDIINNTVILALLNRRLFY